MKNIKCIYLLSVVCIFLLYACGGKTPEKKFFDVPGYFKEEIDSIKQKYKTVDKMSIYNGDTNRSELKVADVNWDKEFALFLESDINKPVYYANMEVIHTPYDPTESNILYQSQSKKLNIQSVKITSINGDVVDINIHISKSNLISNTTIDAYYSKGIRYSIIGTQTVKRLGEKNNFWVVGRLFK